MKQKTKSLEEMKDGGGDIEDLKKEEIPFMSPNELVKHCVIVRDFKDWISRILNLVRPGSVSVFPLVTLSCTVLGSDAKWVEI